MLKQCQFGPAQEESPGLSEEGCLLDPLFLKDFFDVQSPAPVFFEDCLALTDSILREDMDDISMSFLEEDFGSCKWDIDSFFQDPFSSPPL